MLKNYRKILFGVGLVLLFGVSLAIAPISTWAARLYLESSQDEYRVGDTFLVELKIDTEAECINAVKVDLGFSQDILKAVDFGSGDSLLTLWTEPPKISQDLGLVYFSGGVPGGYCGRLPGDPGASNSLGKIIFEAKKEGEAEIKFSENCQALLNDGFGTQANLRTQGAILNILAKTVEVPKDEWQKKLGEDTVLPESFKIEIHQSPTIFEGKYFIIFSTTDKQTGIDYYEIKEGKRDWQRIQSPYLLENQKLTEEIKVRAIDKAGNERVETTEPKEKPIFPYQIVLGLGAILLILGYWLIRKLKKKNERSKSTI